MPTFALIDWTALAVFVLSWAGYAWLVDFSPWRERTLTAIMDRQRVVWMETMLRREVRIVDTAIIAGLQNGTAFFASTSLLAIGATFALMTNAERGLELFGHLPFTDLSSTTDWEFKSLGLLAIYAYAFFKFGWSYRLFNYASILIGAVPPAAGEPTAEAGEAAARAARMNVLAGRHFTRGQRAFFFSVGFLGWFAGAWIFLVITIAVVFALARRQFAYPAIAFRSGSTS